MNQENSTALESNNQILAATLDARHTLSLKAAGDGGGLVRPHKAGVRDVDALEAPTDETWLELRTDGLDLGQLRHG